MNEDVHMGIALAYQDECSRLAHENVALRKLLEDNGIDVPKTAHSRGTVELHRAYLAIAQDAYVFSESVTGRIRRLRDSGVNPFLT